MFNPLFLVQYNSLQIDFDQFDVNAMELGLSGFLNGTNSKIVWEQTNFFELTIFSCYPLVKTGFFRRDKICHLPE